MYDLYSAATLLSIYLLRLVKDKSVITVYIDCVNL